MRRRNLFLTLGFAFTAMLGYWLAGTATQKEPVRPVSVESETAPKRPVVADEPAPQFRRGERGPVFRRDDEASEAGALPGQRVLVFKDREALEDFLKRAGDKVRLMGRLDALNALRIGFGNYDDLASLLRGDEESSLIFPVDVPTPGEGTAQDGAVALGKGLLEWLGITGDNSEWGSGVRVAVLDTGVATSPAFLSNISWLNLVDLPGDLSKQNGHGTAVASMIIGQNALTPGVAPGADIISIRIANDLGQSDSYLLAQGIIAAVDGGASLINISMGSFGDSGLVRNAIAYAQAAGALIIAAAGNNGIDRLSYPAANDGVIAVGAVDALGNHLDFSNTGNQLAISAPGFGVNAAWTGDQAASVNGTSFSSPIVAGAIAALMSQPGAAKLTATQARNLLFAYLNDSGQEGTDSAYGAGMPDLGRALNANTRGIYDAAVASQRILPPSAAYPNGQVEVMVQNRGTETLINTGVTISTPHGVVNTNITSLGANAVKTIRIPISQAATTATRYDSRVTLSNGVRDSKPSNDRRSQSYAPAGGK
ncbi:S8 family serine peptidase [Luteolibacter yonseiensis]|uniref:S8 family serine peptidase n=1 Tax=Luteolibacter yonseiensis TaxID=1144680 RepID=A0A934R6X5_9BACT|nr:S8 family serine peptidase [Luteolibacter yonseiensis]MBK1817472.1 S8 family serine peptidase [Luteolibacter yonseiensis]